MIIYNLNKPRFKDLSPLPFLPAFLRRQPPPVMFGEILTAVLLLFAAPTTAEIKSIKIRSDKRSKIVFEEFGFTRTGHVSVTVSSVSITSPLLEPNRSRVGFFLLPRESRFKLIGHPDLCALDAKFISLLFTFKDVSSHPQSSFHKLYPVTYPDNYILHFANCNPRSLVTMDVRTVLYNTDVANTKDFLSAGITQLPYIYLTFAFIYLCFLVFWVLVCFKNRHQRNFHKIHLVMGGLLVVTVLNLMFASADRGYVKVTGTPHGWNVLFYIFQLFRSVLVYFVIVLIGAGWSFLKPLGLKEKMVLMILFVIQCMINVASIMIRETGPFDKNWETWINVCFVAKITCIVVTYLSLLCTPAWLREREDDAKAARSLPTGLLYVLYALLICIYLISKINFWNAKISGEKEFWWVYNTGTNSADEIMDLMFYMLIFYMLRPVEKNKFFVLDVENELEVTELGPDKNEQFVLVCISRKKYEEAAKMGLWDEEDKL